MAEQTDEQRAAEERVLELCDMDYERAAATAAEFDRLRAELAETRAAAGVLYGALSDPRRIPVADDVVARALTGWERLACGDALAPAEPPADGCVNPLSAGSGECVRKDYCGSGGSCQPTQLPVTLSSPGAAAAVCERAGLTRNGDEWYDDGVRVARVARQGWLMIVFRHWPMYGRQPIAELHPGAPSSLLLAAIEAARGGSR